MAEEKSSMFSLSSVFKIAAVALAVNVFWGLALGPVLDPSFFYWTHDPSNPIPQAVAMTMEPVKDFTLWALGLEGDGPLSGIVQGSILAPALQQLAAEKATVAAGAESLGNQLLGGLNPS